MSVYINDTNRVRKILPLVVNDEENYCEGFLGLGHGKYYLLGLNLSIGKVKKNLGHTGSKILDEINAFDKAEVQRANIGQINMIAVSSFCGPKGLIWGLDLAKPNDLFSKMNGFAKEEKVFPGLKFYKIQPLLKSFEALVGTVDKKLFSFLPGSHVPCATKSIKKEGPVNLYCSIALGIPKNRERDAVLMMEDVGFLSAKNNKDAYRRQLLRNSARSIIEIGKNQRVKFDSIFLGMEYEYIDKDEIGCALVASPYFSIPKNAIPKKGVDSLLDISLEKWLTICQPS